MGDLMMRHRLMVEVVKHVIWDHHSTVVPFKILHTLWLCWAQRIFHYQETLSLLRRTNRYDSIVIWICQCSHGTSWSYKVTSLDHFVLTWFYRIRAACSRNVCIYRVTSDGHGVMSLKHWELAVLTDEEHTFRMRVCQVWDRKGHWWLHWTMINSANNRWGGILHQWSIWEGRWWRGRRRNMLCMVGDNKLIMATNKIIWHWSSPGKDLGMSMLIVLESCGGTGSGRHSHRSLVCSHLWIIIRAC